MREGKASSRRELVWLRERPSMRGLLRMCLGVQCARSAARRLTGRKDAAIEGQLSEEFAAHDCTEPLPTKQGTILGSTMTFSLESACSKFSLLWLPLWLRPFTSQRRSRGAAIAGTYLLYMLFFYVGLMGVLTAYAHVFRPVGTSASIGWPTSPYEYEVGWPT